MIADMEKKEMTIRPPVVAVLGHVDHGKSSLLEAIREDFVITAKESGGITQHIGAYEVEIKGKKITFIDTPGHEAFSAMRQRGAHAADIAILVIDAVEGVKPQTKEAIKFIQKAEIPMIVAFNKMDKPGADPERVKPFLSKVDVLVESYGGKVPSVNVSAKDKTGIKELLETILLLAEMEELKADLVSKPQGIVIESSVDPQKGPVATLIVERGVLQEGDLIKAGFAFGKVKGLCNFEGESIEKVLPSQVAIVLGFNAPPKVGEVFRHCETVEEEIAESAIVNPKIPEDQNSLNLVLKTDVLGSKEAIEDILKNIPQEKIVLRILKSEAGDISVKDVKLAESSHARLYGFRVKADDNAKIYCHQNGLKMKLFDVIYELVQEIRKDMTNALAPETKRVDLAKFKVTHLFKQGKEQIIGGKVMEGEITRGVKAEIMREEELVGQGRIRGLQKDKSDLGKAEKGQQIGMMFEGDIELEQNDILVVFKEESKKGIL